MASFVFKMPDIGEGIVETEVVEWYIAPGDVVAEDAPLADVMTDKATVEITAPVAGKIIRIGCAAGEKMVIGADFVEFDTDSDAPSANGEPQTPAANESNVTTPSPATTSSAAPIADAAPANEAKPAAVSEPQSSPAADAVPVQTADSSPNRDLDTPSLPPAKPKIRVTHEGDTAASAKTADLPATAAPVSTPALTPEVPTVLPKSVESASTQTRDIVPASPAVRRLASELGLQLADIAGSGPAGRVTKEDIRRLLKPAARSNTAASGRTGSSNAAVNSDSGTVAKAAMQTSSSSSASRTSSAAGLNREVGAIEAVPVKGLRRLIAQRMQESKREIPHFSYVEEVRVDKLEDLRAQLNADREESMPKISLLHLIMLGISRVVKDWPQCNANFDDESETLNQFERVHLGVATMTDNGLMVPVVANACQLGLWEIANEVNRLAEAARSSTLSREELTGGTLTVTSLGTLAGIATTPVINRPETSIIGPNKMMKRVEMLNGVATEIRVMNISSSFDHRVVDGYDAASFIQELKKRLETPALLFLD